MEQNNTLGIELYLESVSTLWVIDVEFVDDGLVMFGFEEHFLNDEDNQTFKTEQILDVEELTLIKLLIDKALERLR